MGHSKHIGSSKNREEARKKAYTRAQALNTARNAANLVQSDANRLKVAQTGAQPEKKADGKTLRPGKQLRKIERASQDHTIKRRERISALVSNAKTPREKTQYSLLDPTKPLESQIAAIGAKNDN